MTLNRDTLIALCLLVLCGGLMAASFQIREPDYGQLSPAAWPRAIIVAISVLSGLYLVQSLRQGPDAVREKQSFAGFLAHWRNVIWVFVFFLAYLFAIPWVGLLIGGVLFAFFLLNALGGWRSALLHAVIALVAVGGMWMLFTFVLDVRLPRGEWTGF